MLCKGCGCEITHNQGYCSNCGIKIEAPADKLSTKRCIHCGKRFSDEQIICDVCGGNLVLEQKDQSMSTIPQVPNHQNQSMSYYQATPTQSGSYQTTLKQDTSYQSGSQHTSPYQNINHIPSNTTANQNNNYQQNIPPMFSYNQNIVKKKKNILLPIIIGVLAIVFVVVAFIVVTKFVGFIKDKDNRLETSDTVDAVIDSTTKNIIVDEDTAEDNVVVGENDNVINSTDQTTDSTSDQIANKSTYNILYSYSELPDVISIDSDSRFTYYDYYSDIDLTSYIYSFDNTASVEDLNKAIDDYSVLLISVNNFYYEEDFSNSQYAETGILTDYFSKDNVVIGITSKLEAQGWLVYVDIFDMSLDVSDTYEGSTTLYYNYSYYLENRENKLYDLGTEVVMENGIAFYLNDVIVTDLGDGTAQIDCNMDLAAAYSDVYLYTDSFLLLPMDNLGYFVGDASLIEYVVDSAGQYLASPYLLSTEYYYKYTVSFIVPADTMLFSIYGTNLTNGYITGPVYYVDMTLEQY